jgi:Fic family protein
MRGGMIELDDSSSSEEDEPKKKIDKKELMNYAKMLSHLLGHIEDPKEPIDKKDYRDAKKLIDDMEKVKRGRGRPRKNI